MDFKEPINIRNDVRNEMRELFSSFLTKDMTVYDIGCGDKPFKSFLDARIHKYIGVDIEDGFYDASHIDVIGDAYNVPVDAGCADAVISNQVVEHLEEPVKALSESNRILKDKGLLFLAYPFMYPVHAAPRDYHRYTEFRTRNMLEATGFEVVKLKRIGGFWYCLGLYLGIYFSVLNRGFLKRFGIYTVISFIIKFPFLLLHTLEGLLLKAAGKNPDDIRSPWTCNYIFLARKTRSIDS